ncbi:PDC2 protein [Phytophthora cinnamomi]|uniref:PDC2 protein n=1 Tax=Phytophthora cinnamomi TaxID=4785 RepID=UPI003559F50F|nr:PDC2 protein [Phytophthora cinnamomi]
MGAWMKLDAKRAIIQKAAESPKMTQFELAVWATVTLNLRHTPAQTTISDIFKNAPAIMSEAYGDGTRRKPLRVISLRLEKRLWAWIQEVEQLDLRKQIHSVYELVKDVEKKPLDKKSLGKGVYTYAVNQLKTMEWSREIWNEMQTQRTVENCFKHTDISFNGMNGEAVDFEGSSYGGDVAVDEVVFCASQIHF